jgi:hypothetical protein
MAAQSYRRIAPSIAMGSQSFTPAIAIDGFL